MSLKVEIVIIGGGIVGASVAYHLVKKGYKNIMIVEKNGIASGSTGRSSAVLRQFYTHETVVDMARIGLEYYANFEEITGFPSDFTKTGFILAGNESNRAILEKGLAIQKRLGIKSRMLTKEEIQMIDPGLNLNEITLGLYEEEAGYADAHASCLGFATYARDHGAVLLQGAEVLNIKCDSAGVHSLMTSLGTIETRTVINCGGPWADKIGAMVGIHLPLETSRHHLIAVQLPETNRRPRPIFSDPIHLVYIRPEGKMLSVIGSNHPDDAKDLVNPDECSDSSTAEKVSDLLERSSHRMPFFAEGLVAGDWSGIYDVSPDGFPILDKSKEVPGFYTAYGLSGHGFKLAPAIGQIMSSLVADAEPDPRARMFRLSRYAENEPIESVTTSALSKMKHTAK